MFLKLHSCECGKTLFSCSNTSKNEFVSQDRSLSISLFLFPIFEAESGCKGKATIPNFQIFLKKSLTFFSKNQIGDFRFNAKAVAKVRQLFQFSKFFLKKCFKIFLRTIFCAQTLYRTWLRVQSNDINSIYANFLKTFFNIFCAEFSTILFFSELDFRKSFQPFFPYIIYIGISIFCNFNRFWLTLYKQTTINNEQGNLYFNFRNVLPSIVGR